MPSKTLPPEELLFTSHYSCDIDESPYIVMKKNEYEKLMRFEGGRIPTDYTVAQIGDRFVVLNRHDYRMLVGGLEMIFYLYMPEKGVEAIGAATESWMSEYKREGSGKGKVIQPFIVNAGAKVGKVVPSLSSRPNDYDERMKLEKSGAIADGVLTEQVDFNNASQAASVISGASMSGNEEWRNVKTLQTLGETYYRAERQK
ncbi:DUF4357 domain-containing protein [Rubinisphaera brasiliensis]|uniref:DUF4357 domain-containing protein n=1 Tax=Rubinisphaera brasiliensis (strain ATCC 49424 / DSM 5305 / JCM 21570 / IAM 15109 / NBRC 103401 / IFAM 1448) TaxID=756272 RepID=F0SQP9_RUBBR|nr:DUF4357 domain-containing protein [Rubinisphaera brasiliensis]ADY59079.1 hypothetical protein Plabr_1468 [Rubinisphaera brasiliensis DSM 5305]